MSTQELKQVIKDSLPRIKFSERIDKISLFGSRLHGDARPDSDIDLLVEFNHPVSFFQLYDIEEGLEKVLGHKVDVVTPKALSKFFRDEVIAEAEVLYEK
jgi:predicted nucleotidyltransferase